MVLCEQFIEYIYFRMFFCHYAARSQCDMSTDILPAY